MLIQRAAKAIVAIFFVFPALLNAQVTIRDTLRIGPPMSPDPFGELVIFDIVLQPNPVVVGEAVTVTAIARDIFGNEIPLDGSTCIILSSVAPAHGIGTTVINVGGDSSLSSSLSFSYDALRSGNIRVVPQWAGDAQSNQSDFFVALMTCSSGPPFTSSMGFTAFAPPLSGFRLEAQPDTIRQGGRSVLTVVPLDAAGNELVLYRYTPLNLQYFSERQYGSFVYPEGDTVPTSSVHVYNGDARAGRIVFVANGIVPDSTAPVLLFVNTRWPSQASFGVETLYISPEGGGLDHFRVVASPETIFYGGTTTLTVIAEDAQGNEIPLDAETQLTFAVNDTAHGNFIGADDSIRAHLANVRYGDARSGRIRFVANGSPPTFPTTFAIHVTGAARSGTGNLTILPVPIRLIFTVEPAEVYPAGTGGNSTTSVHVRATRNDQAVEGVILQLEVKALDGSGGHDHTEGRPVGTLSSSVGETDASGFFVTTYTASAFGGTEKIVASVPSNPSRDSVEIIVRVPGLVNFAQISSDFWRLTGNTGNTTACNGPAIPIRHPSNHFGAQETIDSLQLAIEDFHVWSGTPEGGGQPITLGINDMSLENGGAFDIRSDWNRRRCHTFHRLGLSVDINNTGLRLDDGTLTARGRKLKEFMGNHGGEKIPEEPIHFGFGGN